MFPENQRLKAKNFFELHHSGEVLLVPNAWDFMSAKIFELEGFKVIGTTSAGIANSQGLPDGQKITLDENLLLIEKIVGRIDLPVTADIEAGYTNDLDLLQSNIIKVVESGAVGINIEDSPGISGKPLLDIELQKEKIIAIKEICEKIKFNLFLNARIDTFLFLNLSMKEKLDETFKRAEAFIEAGADSIFVPDTGILMEEEIKLLCQNIKVPLNLLAGNEKISIGRLREMGVRRISFGPRFFRALLTNLREISREILDEGIFQKVSRTDLTASVINKWLQK